MKNNEYQITSIKKIKGLFQELYGPYRSMCAKQSSIAYYVPYENSMPWEWYAYRSFKYTHKLQSGYHVRINEYITDTGTPKQTIVVKITRK